VTDPTPPPVPPYGAAPPPVPQPGYQAQPGYPGQIAYPAPPGAYAVPVGGYQTPAGGYSVPPTAPPASRMLGVASLVAAVIAAVVVPILGGVFGFQIGTRVPSADLLDATGEDLAFLTPARLQVLWAEIAFWAGTALGLLAIVLGVISAARRRGRGFGITAIVLAALGPVFFFVATLVLFGIGAAAGSLPAV